jgi:hypothetical protein
VAPTSPTPSRGAFPGSTLAIDGLSGRVEIVDVGPHGQFRLAEPRPALARRAAARPAHGAAPVADGA